MVADVNIDVEGDAAAFALDEVAATYPLRAPYPLATIDFLVALVVEPRVVLDLGTGDGTIARPLAPRVEAVHAVDPSAAMLAAGRARLGGDAPNIRWSVGTAETVPLDGPYGLVTAAASWHWMDGPRVLARVRPVMAQDAFLALVWDEKDPTPWAEEMSAILRRYAKSRGNPQLPSIAELIQGGLYRSADRVRIPSNSILQTVEDYIEQLHATAMGNRKWMGEDAARRFDDEAREVLSKYVRDGLLEYTVGATVEYGRPA